MSLKQELTVRPKTIGVDPRANGGNMNVANVQFYITVVLLDYATVVVDGVALGGT